MGFAAKLVFLFIIGVAVYTYAGYPLVLFLLGTLRRKKKPEGAEAFPSVALIISAYNEERIIREKIKNSLELTYPRDKLKIIVASDGSIDGTDNIVMEFERENVFLKKFDKREGKSATLNRTVLGIDEEILVFSDANAFYRKNALRELVKRFTDPEVGCVVGRLVYMHNHSYVGKGESLYWRYESLLNRLEGRLGSLLVATGTIFAVRRQLFRPVLKDVANDFQLPAEVASQGYRVVFESEAIAYERSTYFFREEFSRKRRIIVRGLTGFKNLKGNFGGVLRIFQFISRKLLRWWIGPLLPALYVSNAFLLGRPLFLGLFLLQNAFYALALVGAILRRGNVPSRVFFIPFYFVLVNAAALAAIMTYFAGDRLSAWEKAETTRDVHERGHLTPRLRVVEGKKELSYQGKGEGIENLEGIT